MAGTWAGRVPIRRRSIKGLSEERRSMKVEVVVEDSRRVRWLMARLLVVLGLCRLHQGTFILFTPEVYLSQDHFLLLCSFYLSANGNPFGESCSLLTIM